MNVLIILGHPRQASFGAALAQSFGRGAREAGQAVEFLALAELEFRRDVVAVSPSDQALEPDLVKARALITWADHLVVVTPVWWGTMPALLKAFFDRVLTPGYAFQYAAAGTDWYPLLTGKTAQVLLTVDTPRFVYRWIYRAPTSNALRRATFEFCGIKPVRVRVFGSVIRSDARRRERWLDQAFAAGRALRSGFPNRTRHVLRDATAWIKALRLQFYPMSWAAYTIGALLARGAACFDQQSYWWGYLALFLLEAATVFVNDLVDFEGDCVNGCAGPFNGGSRVLVTGAVERRPLLRAVGLTLAGALGSAIIAGLTSPHPVAAFAMLAAMAVLALGYTAPPLKLCYRALGELDVAFTHSLGMILCGVALLGGNPFGAAPWLLGLPLFLSIVPAITLSGFPDRRADASVGKHTLAVHLGATGAAAVAILAVIGAAAMAWAWPYLTPDVAGYRYLVYLAAPHAVALTVLCVRFLQRGAPVKRIDGLMVVALTFILWFCVVPLVALLGPSGGA